MTIKVEIQQTGGVLNLTSGRTVESAVNTARMLAPANFDYPNEGNLLVNGSPAPWNRSLIDGDHLVLTHKEEEPEVTQETRSPIGPTPVADIDITDLVNSIVGGNMGENSSQEVVINDPIGFVAPDTEVQVETAPAEVEDSVSEQTVVDLPGLIQNLDIVENSIIRHLEYAMMDLSAQLENIENAKVEASNALDRISTEHALLKEHMNNAREQISGQRQESTND